LKLRKNKSKHFQLIEITEQTESALIYSNLGGE